MSTNIETQMLDLGQLAETLRAELQTAGHVPLTQQNAIEEPRSERIQVMLFEMATDYYSIDARYIAEVVRDYELTPLPTVPSWLKGVMNLHGDIVSVVDLAGFLELPRPKTPSGKLIIVKSGDIRVGLMVDRVMMIHVVPLDDIVSPPFVIDQKLVPFLRGVFERDQTFIRLLDCDSLLISQKMQQFS